MPQIPVYDVPQSEQRLNVPEGGAAGLATAARRVGTLGQETAQSTEQGYNKLASGLGKFGQELDAVQTAHETSQILPKLALHQADAMEQINGIAYGSDPNNITQHLNDYKAQVLDPQKEEFLSGFSTTKGRETAEASWGKYEANLYHHAAAVSMQASSDAQRTNLVNGNNQLVSNVGKDPSLLDHNLELADAAIQGASSSSTISPALRHTLTSSYSASVKQDMVANAVKTLAETNPDGARQMLASGKYDQYIGNHIGTLNTFIDTQERLAASKGTAAKVQAQKTEDTAAKSAITDTVSQTITPQGVQVGPDYFKKVQDILTMPGAQRDPELVKSMIDYGQAATARQQKGIQATTDPATMQNLTDRMLLDPWNPHALTYKDIYSASAQGKLSDQDLSFLNQTQTLRTQDPHNPAFHQLQTTLDQGRTALATNNGSGITTPASAAAYQRFQQYAVKAYASGTPIDPKTMPDVLARFKPTGADAVDAIPQGDRPLVPGGALLSRPPTDAQLPHLVNFESSDRNITNPVPTSSGHAEGYAQITTGTWKDFAPGAGVDLAKFPTPLTAPKNVQLAVAKTIPLQRWDPKTLRYLRSQGVL